MPPPGAPGALEIVVGPEGKPIVIIIPVVSGQPVALSNIAPTFLVLLDAEQFETLRQTVHLMSIAPFFEASGGDQVLFPLGSGGFASLTAGTRATRPDALPADYEFVSAMTINLDSGGSAVSTLPGGLCLTISFVIPKAFWGRTLAILYWNGSGWIELPTVVMYWNPTLNGGLGGWVTNPSAGELSGMTEGRAVATSNVTGLYVLVAR